MKAMVPLQLSVIYLSEHFYHCLRLSGIGISAIYYVAVTCGTCGVYMACVVCTYSPAARIKSLYKKGLIRAVGN